MIRREQSKIAYQIALATAFLSRFTCLNDREGMFPKKIKQRAIKMRNSATTQVASNLKQTSIITQDHIAPSFVATILSSASSTNSALNTKFNHGNKFTHVQDGHDSLKPIHPIHVLTSKEKSPLPLFQVLNYFSPIFAHTRGVGKSYNWKFRVDLKVLVDEFRPVLNRGVARGTP